MNFKDKRYYMNKVKECLGMVATALMFDAVLLMCIVLA